MQNVPLKNHSPTYTNSAKNLVRKKVSQIPGLPTKRHSPGAAASLHRIVTKWWQVARTGNGAALPSASLAERRLIAP
ncbi:hypothetical protein CHELA20_50259 [Hyphomicrobiales bacterium]|nr:hypothetical protein CHELA20_50259 [Hyphomicrobiales bacterium]